MNKLKQLRWPVALILTAAAAFCFGYQRATNQREKTNAALQAVHACAQIELLKNGGTDEAIRIETLYLNLMLKFTQQDVPLLPGRLGLVPLSFHMNGAMSYARSLRRDYPDIAFNSHSITLLEEFERSHPYPQ